MSITVAGDERLQRTASVAPLDALPDWVLAKIGTGAPVTFSDDDQLGRELLRRWRAALDPAASGQDYWGIMGALAWIATRDMELARRAAIFDCACIGRPKVQPMPSRPGVMRLGRQAQPRDDGKRRHELACLAHELFANGHCDCAPRPAEWSDCRCLDRAFDKLLSAIEGGELPGYAWDGEVKRRGLTGADLIRVHRRLGELPWLVVANGIRRVEIDAAAVQITFPRYPGSATPAEIEAWIRDWLVANRSLAAPGPYTYPWEAFNALSRFAGCNRDDCFMPVWKKVTGNRGRGRVAKFA